MDTVPLFEPYTSAMAHDEPCTSAMANNEPCATCAMANDEPRTNAMANDLHTSGMADDVVQMPSSNGVRRMFDLAKAACDPATLAPQMGLSRFDANFASHNISPSRGDGAGVSGLVGRGTRCQWICPLTADEWVDSGTGPLPR
ncbi:hypothetical protein T484DRAFT_1920662 [Baffinella frigidus]|nr:hypothetical protein T484DRAFT_1920662 [Cryptophyta sp. CCMP2293]